MESVEISFQMLHIEFQILVGFFPVNDSSPAMASVVLIDLPVLNLPSVQDCC